MFGGYGIFYKGLMFGLVADDMLYLFSENGGRAALATCSPDGLEIRGEVKVQGTDSSWAHPVVIGGRLYLRYADNLYCFSVKAE